MELKQVVGWPSASIETCAPPLLISRTAPITSVVSDALIVATAPISLAKSSLSLVRSIAITLAPMALAIMISRKTDAAAAVDGHPLSRQALGARSTIARNDVMKRQPRLAAVAKSSASRQPHQVGVGKVERNIFGERAPRGKSRLELVLADLVIARIAFEAMAAADCERHRDAIAGAPLRDLASDRLDRSGEFMARHMRQPDVGVVPHPAVPVASAKSRCLHLDDHALRSRGRVGHVLHARRLREIARRGRLSSNSSNSFRRWQRLPSCSTTIASRAGRRHGAMCDPCPTTISIAPEKSYILAPCPSESPVPRSNA